MSAPRLTDRPTSRGDRVGLAEGALHLGALCALAIAQPYLEPLGDAPEVLVERGFDGSDVILLALIFVALPPLLLVAMEGVAGLVRPVVGYALHLLFVAALVALIAWQALGGASALSYALALAIGGVAAGAYHRAAGVRMVGTVLSPGPLVVLALYLLLSPTSALVTGGNGDVEEVRGASASPVVFVLFDELPVGSLMDLHRRIDSTRVPAFARLAREATWYRQAATVADYSQLAVPALLSGRRVGRGPAPVAAEHPDNLFTLLGRSHRIDASEQLTDLCAPAACPARVRDPLEVRIRSALRQAVSTIPALPPRLRTSLAGRLAPDPPRRGSVTRYDDRGVSRHEHAGQPERFSRFLATLPGVGSRTLHFIHLVLPHRPWKFLPSGRALPPGLRANGEDVFGRWPRDPGLIRRAWRRHLLQTGYADRLLGRAIGRLRQLGVWDRALVVVTADHGTSFIPGQEARIVTAANAGDVGPVPLFVKEPRQRRGRIDDRPAETVDIVPEVARILNVEIPWKVDGRPLGGAVARRRNITIERQQGGQVTVSRRALMRGRQRSLQRMHRFFDSGRALEP